MLQLGRWLLCKWVPPPTPIFFWLDQSCKHPCSLIQLHPGFVRSPSRSLDLPYVSPKHCSGLYLIRLWDFTDKKNGILSDRELGPYRPNRRFIDIHRILRNNVHVGSSYCLPLNNFFFHNITQNTFQNEKGTENKDNCLMLQRWMK